MRLPSLSLLSTLWLSAEFILMLVTRFKSGTKASGAKSRDRASLPLIWIICAASSWLGIYVAMKWHSWPWPLPDALKPVGYWIFIVGVLFRWYAIYYLGRFFTPNVVILEKHRLIETGPYRLIRHPTYAGALFALLGVTLTMGNLLSLLIIFIPIISVVAWRMRIEEAALVEAFGDEYRDYMRRTKRLIPFVF